MDSLQPVLDQNIFTLSHLINPLRGDTHECQHLMVVVIYSSEVVWFSAPWRATEARAFTWPLEGCGKKKKKQLEVFLTQKARAHES